MSLRLRLVLHPPRRGQTGVQSKQRLAEQVLDIPRRNLTLRDIHKRIKVICGHLEKSVEPPRANRPAYLVVRSAEDELRVPDLVDLRLAESLDREVAALIHE